MFRNPAICATLPASLPSHNIRRKKDRPGGHRENISCLQDTSFDESFVAHADSKSTQFTSKNSIYWGSITMKFYSTILPAT